MISRGIINILSNHIFFCLYITLVLPPINCQFVSLDSYSLQLYISCTKIESLRKEYTLPLEITEQVVKKVNNGIYNSEVEFLDPWVECGNICLFVSKEIWERYLNNMFSK